MSAIDNSLAFKTNFLLTFSRLPGVQLFLQDAIIPSISLSTIIVPNPRLDFPIIGDKMEFQPLTLSFLIDENFSNFYEIYNWMFALRDPNAGGKDKLNEQTDADLADGTLTVLNNNKVPIAEFTFVDCFPTDLDGALFDVAAEGSDPQIANLTVSYTLYTMKLLGANPAA